MDAILLSPSDNVAVLAHDVPAGAVVRAGDRVLTAERAIGLGHKIALGPIARGGRIVKHGAAIGSATRDIEPGEHVHVHNMRSDYLPTHARRSGRDVEGTA